MSDMSIFYSSMSNVMNQWSDFRVARNMYRDYFAQQKQLVQRAGDQYKTEKEFTNKNDSLVSDQLKELTDKTAESASKLSGVISSDEFDIEKAYKAADEFVGNYNKLITSTNESGNTALKSKTDYLKNMSVIYGDRFLKEGISVKNDGTLELNKDKFMKADETTLKNTLGNKNSFATYVSNQAKQLSKFAESDAYLNNKTYYNPQGLSNTLNNNASLLSGYMYNSLA